MCSLVFSVDLFVISSLLRKAPAIIFIDELDAIGQKRSGGGELSGVREVQRTMLELLNQLAARHRGVLF